MFLYLQMDFFRGRVALLLLVISTSCIFSHFMFHVNSFYSVSLFVYLSVRLSIHLSLCWSIRLSICLYVHLSVCPSVFLTVYSSVFRSVHLYVCLSLSLQSFHLQCVVFFLETVSCHFKIVILRLNSVSAFFIHMIETKLFWPPNTVYLSRRENLAADLFQPYQENGPLLSLVKFD